MQRNIMNKKTRQSAWPVSRETMAVKNPPGAGGDFYSSGSIHCQTVIMFLRQQNASELPLLMRGLSHMPSSL
jgi:hypothetical protein